MNMGDSFNFDEFPQLFKELENEIVYNISVQNLINVEIISELLLAKYNRKTYNSDEVVARTKALYCLALYHTGKFDMLFDYLEIIQKEIVPNEYYNYIWYYIYLGNLKVRDTKGSIFAERQTILYTHCKLTATSSDENNDSIVRRLKLFATPDLSMLFQKKAYLLLDTQNNINEAVACLKFSVKLNSLNMESVLKLNELNVSDIETKSVLAVSHNIKDLSKENSVEDIGNLFYAIYKAIESFNQNDYFKCIRIIKKNLYAFLDTRDEMGEVIASNVLLYYIIYKCFIELFDYNEAYEILCKKIYESDGKTKLYYNEEPASNNIFFLKELYITASVNLWQSFKITSDFKYVNTLYDFVHMLIFNKQTHSLPCMISMAMLYCCLNENEQALKLLNKTIQKYPHYYYTYNLLANEYINVEEYDIAFKVFSKSLVLNKYFYKTYYSLGLLFLNNGDYEKSLPQLLESLRLNKVNVIVLSTIGINLEKLNKTEEAKKYYKLVLNLYSEIQQNIFIKNYINLSHFKLANLAYQEKNYIEAFNILSEYTKPNFRSYPYSSGTFCNIYFLLSQIYLKLDDTVNSLSFKNKAISLDPSIVNK
ncbi:hypothetical protein QEN19_003291 [Hanseniaspora menglaensis]